MNIAQPCLYPQASVYSLPEDGWFGTSLGSPIPLLCLKWVFGNIFTDVSSSEGQPQHGRQRSIVEHNANLTQVEIDIIKIE